MLSIGSTATLIQRYSTYLLHNIEYDNTSHSEEEKSVSSSIINIGHFELTYFLVENFVECYFIMFHQVFTHHAPNTEKQREKAEMYIENLFANNRLSVVYFADNGCEDD